MQARALRGLDVVGEPSVQRRQGASAPAASLTVTLCRDLLVPGDGHGSPPTSVMVKSTASSSWTTGPNRPHPSDPRPGPGQPGRAAIGPTRGPLNDDLPLVLAASAGTASGTAQPPAAVEEATGRLDHAQSSGPARVGLERQRADASRSTAKSLAPTRSSTRRAWLVASLALLAMRTPRPAEHAPHQGGT